jgi:hypothetical protein
MLQEMLEECNIDGGDAYSSYTVGKFEFEVSLGYHRNTMRRKRLTHKKNLEIR